MLSIKRDNMDAGSVLFKSFKVGISMDGEM